MKKIIFTILLFSLNAFAQSEFEIKNASDKFDVKIDIEKCEDTTCEGRTTFTLFEKGKKKMFQKFDFENSSILLNDDKKIRANITLLYDEQSALHFDDFNFDGVKDLALNDGNNGGYGGPSYQIYLFSKAKNKFIRSKSFTDLSQGVGLGMFEVDSKRNMLYVFSKSGCCWHMTEGYKVIRNRPVKVYELTEDATVKEDGEYVKVTTKKLIKGKWQTWVKRKKIEDE